MSVRPRSVAGIAVAAVIGAGALFALPAAGFASDAADRTELVRHRHERLTEEQRECLAEQGITRPDGRPTAEERAARREQLQEAAEACGIDLPAPLLTDEQRECLAEQGITRPDGRPTLAERRALRQQLREAADECGIERPLRDGHRCGRHGAETDDPSTTDDSSNTADPAVIPAA